MAFSLKKVFKKVCALGGALMFMSPLIATVANAVGPGTSSCGKRLNNLTAYIAGADYSSVFDSIEVTAKTGLVYSEGVEHVLFNAPIFKLKNEAIASDSAAQIERLKNEYGITPYFRVQKQGETIHGQQILRR